MFIIQYKIKKNIEIYCEKYNFELFDMFVHFRKTNPLNLHVKDMKTI